MKVIKTERQLAEIMRDDHFFICREQDRTNQRSWGGICSISPRVFGVYLSERGYEPVVLSKGLFISLTKNEGLSFAQNQKDVLEYLRKEK